MFLESLDSELLSMVDLTLSDSDPVVIEGRPLRSTVMENFMYMNQMKDFFGTSHSGPTIFELRDELGSELPEGLLVVLNPDMVCTSDVSLGDLDPLVLEVSPNRSTLKLENLKNVHFFEYTFY